MPTWYQVTHLELHAFGNRTPKYSLYYAQPLSIEMWLGEQIDKREWPLGFADLTLHPNLLHRVMGEDRTTRPGGGHAGSPSERSGLVRLGAQTKS
jgi:hypothetical protein